METLPLNMRGRQRRRKAATDVTERPLPTLDEALAYVQQAPAFLHFDGDRGIDLWSPHKKIDIRVRRALRKHQAQIIELMLAGDIRTCSDCHLHRRYWRHAGQQRYVCEACARLTELGVG